MLLLSFLGLLVLEAEGFLFWCRGFRGGGLGVGIQDALVEVTS